MSSLRYLKTDARYWKSKIYRHRRRVGAQVREDKAYSVRIGHQGRREQFCTNETEKSAAASVAAEIYRTLDRDGWVEAIKRHKPGATRSTQKGIEDQGIVQNPTVGDLISAARKFSDVLPKTMADYCRAFRRIVSQIMAVPEDSTRFDYAGGGTAKWRSEVDKVPLSLLTPEKVQQWKSAYVTTAGKDPTSLRASKISANSLIRQSKALFTKRILGLAASSLRLATPLPFDGVEYFKRESMRYVSRIDAPQLLKDAYAELSKSRTEEFKALILALCCGLRRNEIDKLLWSQVDLDKRVIRIMATPYFQPKTEDSTGAVEFDDEIGELLQIWKESSSGEFVLTSNASPKIGKAYSVYRAETTFRGLKEWLMKKGIEDEKFLHVLRKELGSLVAAQHGIFAASRTLRHSDIQVTAAHYLDKKERTSVGLGLVLAQARDKMSNPTSKL